MIAVGVDLSAVPSRASGVAVLQCPSCGGCRFTSFKLYGDVERIASHIINYAPHIVVVDSPLTCPDDKPFRDTERLLIRLGARLLPLTIHSMRRLCRRGMSLYKLLKGVTEVYETHPWSSLRLSGCSTGLILRLLGLDSGKAPRNKDERDALIAAITGAGLRWGLSWIVGGDASFVVLAVNLCGSARSHSGVGNWKTAKIPSCGS